MQRVQPADLGIGLLYWHLRDAVVVAEATSGRVVLWNPTAEALFGYTGDEAVGMPLELLTPERLRPAVRARIARFAEMDAGPLLPAGTPVQLPALHKDGTELLVELSLTGLGEATAPGRFLLAVIRDATTRARQARHAALRADVATALTGAGDVDTALRRCVDALVRHLGAAGAGVWLLDESGQELVPRASAGVSPGLAGSEAPVPVGADTIGRIAAERRPLLTNDVANDPAISDPDWARREGIIAFAGCPLLVEDRLFGVVALVTRSALDADDQTALTGVAKLLAQEIEHTRAQAELERERDLLRVLLDHLPDAVYIKDASSRFVRVSRAAAALYGVDDPAEVVGKTDFDVFPAEQAQQFWADERRVLEEGLPLLNRLERQAGEDEARRWTLATKVPLVDGAGRISGLVGISRDITNLKQAEETLRQSESRYRELFDQAPVMYVVTRDVDGQPVVANCNTLFLATLGYERSEVIGRPLADFAPADARPALLAGGGHHQALAVHVDDQERQLRTRDGRVLDVLMWAWSEPESPDNPGGTRIAFADVTDRRQVQADLQASETRLAQAQQLAKIGSWEWDIAAGTDVVAASDQLFLIFGLVPRSVAWSYAAFLAHVHPDDREMITATIERSLDTAEPFDFEFRTVLPDGEVRVLYGRGEVTVGDDGRPVRMHGTVQDIAERKQAEEALRASQERFRAAFEYAATGMALVGLDGGFLQVNEAFCALTGYTEEELLTRRFQDITHPDDLEADLEQVQRLLAGEIPAYQMEKRYVRGDETVAWVRLSRSLVRDPHDAPLHFIAQVEDISARQQAEERLRHSEARFRSMFDNIKDVITILDTDGNIQFLSPSFQTVLGYDPADMVGRNGFDLIHPDDRAATWAAFARGADDPDYVPQVTIRTRHADGSWRWMEAASSNLLADPDVRGFMINSRDVTARKEAEDALRVSEAQMAAVMRQLPVGVVIVDAASGMVQLHNEFGEELLGRPNLSSSHEDYDRYAGFRLDGTPYRPEENPLARSILTGEVISSERVLFKQDEDETIIIDVSSTPIHDDQGGIMAGVAVYNDVTEQARAEAEIRRLHAELENELRRAAEVQAQLLPQRPPDVPGYAFAGVCIPARQAGGDFFDWQRHPAGVRLALGDVMGKGMPAALLMASVRAALRLAQAMPVAQATTAVNTTLGPDLEAADSFITLFYADVEPASGMLTYIDAGHGMAFIHRRDGQVETVQQRAWPLGIASDAQYRGGSVRLAPGETLVLYSDGLPDGRPDLKLDPEGVAAQLAGVVGVEAQLKHLVALATATGPLVDDLTLVLMQRLDEAEGETPGPGE